MAWDLEQSGLSLFPSQITSNMPHIEILGAPNGDAIFCALLVAEKHTGASKLLLLLMEVGTSPCGFREVSASWFFWLDQPLPFC